MRVIRRQAVEVHIVLNESEACQLRDMPQNRPARKNEAPEDARLQEQLFNALHKAISHNEAPTISEDAATARMLQAARQRRQTSRDQES